MVQQYFIYHGNISLFTMVQQYFIYHGTTMVQQ